MDQARPDFASRLEERIMRLVERRKGRPRPDYAHDAKYEWFRSSPHKLGFARVIEVMFIVHILFTFVSLVFTSRDVIVYSSVTIIDFLNVIFEGVAIWMLTRRVKAARYFIIGFALFNISIGTAYDLLMGTFSWFGQIFSSFFDIILIIYFARSVRVRCLMTRDLRMDAAAIRGDKFVVNRRGWPFFRNLGIYFCVFSVLGHWMEMALCQLIILGLVQGEYDPSNTMLWRDWLYPFPMEGLAVVLIAVLLYPLKEWLLKKFDKPIAAYAASFFANMMTCVAIEFVFGLLWNSDLQLWNYSDMPFNFMGQVCLQNSLAFGVASSIIAWFVYPQLERWISYAGRDAMNIAFVAVLVGYGILQCLYLINPPSEVDTLSYTNTQEEEAIEEDTEPEPLSDEGREFYKELLSDLTQEDRDYLRGVLDDADAAADSADADSTDTGSTDTSSADTGSTE